MIRRCLAVVVMCMAAANASAAQTSRTYVPGRFAVEIEGQFVGFASGVSGGFASGIVVEEQESPDYYFKKHVTLPATYSDISIEFGTNMKPAFYDWVKSAIDRSITYHDGAIVALDSQFNVVRRLTFSSAQMVEVLLPRVDASVRAPFVMTATLRPNSTALTRGGGVYSVRDEPKAASSDGGFRLAIAGMTTSYVTVVEALRISIPPAMPRDAFCISCPALDLRISYPRLEVVLSEASANDFFTWHRRFVLEGISDDANEKTGSLEILDSRNATVFRIAFAGLGIVDLMNEQGTSGTIARVRASMYVEKLSLTQTPIQ